MMLGGAFGVLPVGGAVASRVGVETLERFRAWWRSLEYADVDIINVIVVGSSIVVSGDTNEDGNNDCQQSKER